MRKKGVGVQRSAGGFRFHAEGGLLARVSSMKSGPLLTAPLGSVANGQSRQTAAGLETRNSVK